MDMSYGEGVRFKYLRAAQQRDKKAFATYRYVHGPFENPIDYL